jgi:hypothetical protein
VGLAHSLQTRKYPVPGLVPGTHVFLAQLRGSFKTWMTGPSPATGDFLDAN